MFLCLLTLIKWLVPFKTRKQHSRDVSTDAPLGPRENVEQTVRHRPGRTYRSCATQTTTSIESTHLATSSSSAKSFPPRIPPELMCLILIELWDMPQTPEERCASLQNVVLVNRIWFMFMAFIASRDVHISNKRNALSFIWVIYTRPESPEQAAGGPFTRQQIRSRANDICRSITFYVDGKASTSCPGVLPNIATSVPGLSSRANDACDAISLVLQIVARNPRYIPNLRHIAFQYMDVGYEDIFTHLEQEPFPRQVAHLSAHFAFTKASFTYTLSKQWRRTRDCDRGYAPRQSLAAVVQPFLDVRHLSLSGCTTVVATAIWRVCPNIETLELPVPCPIRLEAMAPLRPALRTLVLRHQGLAALAKLRKDSEKDLHWALCKALLGGLFPVDGARPRKIVVRLSTHDPALFAALQGICARANAELVYERDYHDIRSSAF